MTNLLGQIILGSLLLMGATFYISAFIGVIWMIYQDYKDFRRKSFHTEPGTSSFDNTALRSYLLKRIDKSAPSDAMSRNSKADQ